MLDLVEHAGQALWRTGLVAVKNLSWVSSATTKNLSWAGLVTTNINLYSRKVCGWAGWEALTPFPMSTGNSLVSSSTNIPTGLDVVAGSHPRSDVKGSGSCAIVGSSFSLGGGYSIAVWAGTPSTGDSGCRSVSQSVSGVGFARKASVEPPQTPRKVKSWMYCTVCVCELCSDITAEWKPVLRSPHYYPHINSSDLSKHKHCFKHVC